MLLSSMGSSLNLFILFVTEDMPKSVKRSFMVIELYIERIEAKRQDQNTQE